MPRQIRLFFNKKKSRDLILQFETKEVTSISMHEVLNLACSQESGHLITQLYNVQESHIPYSKNATLTYSNDVFLGVFRTNGRVNYYPRSMNFEYSGGYGFLGKYEFHEPKTNIDSLENVSLKQVDRIAKNEYQQQLDLGGKTDSSMLNVVNTKYWTDYNKLIYRPSSLLQLNNFVHPEGSHKHFEKLKFKNYHQGAEEFKGLQDDVEDVFRRLLESLDNIQGVNLFSELDSGWGGFTNEMLVLLKDEYFNNGVNSKYNIWVYGLASPKENVLSRIKSFVEFSNNSTLFYPLVLEQQDCSLLQESYDIGNLWHRGAIQSAFVNSIWGLNCQVDHPVRMAEIEANVLKGYAKRNIVNEIRIHDQNPENALAEVTMDMYYSGVLPQPKKSCIDLGFNTSSGKPFDTLFVVSDDSVELEGAVYQNKYIDEVRNTDSFPDILKGPFYTEFGQSTALRDTLKNYRTIIQRVRRPEQMDILGDRSELVEDLSGLIEEYTIGYHDSEEDYD